MKIYLTNIASDVSGYKLALIDERNPGATSTVATALTSVAAGSHSLTGQGTTNSMLLTKGGSAAKWITKPFKNAITIPNTRISANYWAKVAVGVSRHAAAWFKLATASSGNTVRAAFVSYQAHSATGMTAAHATQYPSITTNPSVTSTVAQTRYVTSNVGSSNTTIAAGERLVITGKIVNAPKAGTGSVTQVANSFTLDFDGVKDGADGDTWIEIPVNADATSTASGACTAKRQIAGTNTSAKDPALGKAFYQNVINHMDALVAAGTFGMDSKLLAFYQDVLAERDNH